MLKLDLSNVFEAGLLSDPEFEESKKELTPLLKKIESREQGFYKTIDDIKLHNQISAFARQMEGRYEDIVILGIGGSSLGAITLRDSFGHLFSTSAPRMHVLENIDPEMMEEITQKISLKNTLFLVISKSGGTPETLAQYFYFRERLDKIGLSARSHMVFITDPKEGLLRNIAEKENIASFPIPPDVGGRFSVLTAVGLVPAALMGINIAGLAKGAQAMRNRFVTKSFDRNLPYQLAVAQFIAWKKKRTQVVLMPYVTKLRSFAAWYAQLLAESTGKVNKKGKNIGLTPIPALGVTDQHSQMQLFVEGPLDKFVIFMAQEDHKHDPKIPIHIDHPKVNFLKDITFGQLLEAELKANEDTLAEASRPNCRITIDKITEVTMGELFLFFEGVTAFLGEMMEIDAYNQPGVERSKVLTREYLSPPTP